MAYDLKKRNAVRQSYVYKGLDLKDVAQLHAVPYNTVRAWKNKADEDGDSWDRARSAARMGKAGLDELTDKLIESFALQSDALLESLNDDADVSPERRVAVMSKLGDGYSKLVASAAKSGSKVAPLSVAMRVLQMLGDFIKERHPDQAPLFLEILEPFGVKVARELG